MFTGKLQTNPLDHEQARVIPTPRLLHLVSTREISWTVRLRAVIPPCRIQRPRSIMDPIRRYTEYMKPYLAKCERRDAADHGEKLQERSYTAAQEQEQ